MASQHTRPSETTSELHAQWLMVLVSNRSSRLGCDLSYMAMTFFSNSSFIFVLYRFGAAACSFCTLAIKASRVWKLALDKAGPVRPGLTAATLLGDVR